MAENNLPLRGHHEDYEGENGLFLTTLNLISNYDEILKQHLDAVKRSKEDKKRLQVHYLSWRIQNAFLELCGESVLGGGY